jgi:hypothetical protein
VLRFGEVESKKRLPAPNRHQRPKAAGLPHVRCRRLPPIDAMLRLVLSIGQCSPVALGDDVCFERA